MDHLSFDLIQQPTNSATIHFDISDHLLIFASLERPAGQSNNIISQMSADNILSYVLLAKKHG